MKFLIFFVLLVLITGCASITKEQAETEALKFVESNVKFFAKEGGDKRDLPKYNYDNVDLHIYGFLTDL